MSEKKLKAMVAALLLALILSLGAPESAQPPATLAGAGSTTGSGC
jgi:hypothetical protein